MSRWRIYQRAKFRAYYILTQAYLVLDDPIAAEDSYLKLLKVDPEFRTSITKDPVDIYYLSKKFTSRPRFTPHYRLGFNASFPSTLANVSTYSSHWKFKRDKDRLSDAWRRYGF